MVKYAKFDKISNEKLKQFGGKNDVPKSKKFSFAPPLYKCIVVLLAAAAFILTACSGLQEDGGEKNIRINLPPIVSASGNSRALSGDRLPTLKTETRRYRVTVNGMTREGTGSSYDFRLPVGIRATAIIECLNSSGEVIIRAVKDFTVSGGENSIDINLKADGNEIIPSAPQPVPNQVTYSYGEADRHGNKNGIPSDPKTYSEGDLFTVEDGSGMTWDHATQQSGFLGWKTNVALVGDTDSSTADVQANGNVQVGGKYKMPRGGVTLTAQWNKKSYTISYDMNAAGSGGTQTTNISDDTGNEALGPAQVSATKPDAVSIVASGKNFTFTHWLGSDGNTYQPGQSISSITGNLTLTAQWSDKDVWTVTYNKGSTSATEQNITNWKGSDNVVDGESITLPTLQATGYTFNGWQITGEAGNKTGSYRPTGNVDATAQWTPNSYAVTASPGNGVQASEVQNLPSLGQQNYDATVQLGNEPTRTGYTFAGWDVTPTSVQINGSGNSRSFTMPAQAVTLTAQWTAIPYTITYDANGGGTNPGNTTFTVEDAYVTFASSGTLAKTGYTFMTWETTGGIDISNMTRPADLIQLITSGTTLALRAKWEISYKYDRGSWEVGDIVCDNGNALTLANYNAVKTDTELSPAVAVVYKNDSANSKVYIVGKVHDQEFSWSNSTNGAQGDSMNITGLQKEQGYTDGSTGLTILQAAVTDANGSDLADKYPAWDFACNYGTKQGLTNFQTGWYFPSKDDLQEVYDNKDALNTALAKIGVSKTLFEDTDSYWCSTQVASNASNAYDLWIKDGNPTWDDEYKDGADYYVCAVCQLPYY